MDRNAYLEWVQQRSQAKTKLGIQHSNQLTGGTAQSSLKPIAHQSVHNASVHVYLPHPTRYMFPVNHEHLQTHQAPHKQNPMMTTTPNIPSRYFLPVKPLNLGT
jgi:hypothetical protein